MKMIPLFEKAIILQAMSRYTNKKLVEMISVHVAGAKSIRNAA
jgi:hypothetical protein